MTQFSQKDFHLLALAGGAKNLSQPGKPADKKHALFNLGHVEGGVVFTCIDFRFWKMFLLSGELEEVLSSRPDIIALTTHHDCGAYGGFSVFENNTDTELQFHRDQLLRATREICSNEDSCKEILATLFVDGEYNILPEAHACDALVLSCCESPYWQRSFEAAQQEFGIGTFDILTTLGGPSMITRPHEEGFREHLLTNLSISKKLHNIPKGIVLVGHAEGACDSKSDDLEIATDIIHAQESLKDLPVQTLWLD